MLIDTSVWLEFLAPRSRVLSGAALDELAEAIADGSVCTVLPIYAELLSGAKHGDRELRELLAALRFVDLDWASRTVWGAVADLAQEAHRRRLRIPGVVDRMIVAAAREAGETLWALDGPLRRLAQAVGVPTR
jgi:predicted nucleic acid-binding protein